MNIGRTPAVRTSVIFCLVFFSVYIIVYWAQSGLSRWVSGFSQYMELNTSDTHKQVPIKHSWHLIDIIKLVFKQHTVIPQKNKPKYVVQTKSHTDTRKHRLTHDKAISNFTMQNKPCVQTNICMNRPGDQFYEYSTSVLFNEKMNSDIDYNRSIVHDQPVVPKIVHFLLYLGQKKKNYFRFHYLVAVLAAHRFIKPSRIYFWFDKIPEGPYFEETKTKVPELLLVRRLPPTHIYGRPVKVVEHIADILRLEIVLEYGGMYFDLDSIALKSFDPFLKFDLTMGYESPHSLANGIIIATPWADFLKIWHKKYTSFTDKVWAEHSVLLPARLAKKYPNLIHTEKSSFFRPNYAELSLLYTKGKLYDWRTKNYAIHLWFRFHKIDHNPQDIKSWNTTAGEVFRYIYYGDWKLKP